MKPQKHPFDIVIASPPEYNELVAEILFDGKLVALINQERGPNDLEIEFPACGLNEGAIIRRVKLLSFLCAIDDAQGCLLNRASNGVSE